MPDKRIMNIERPITTKDLAVEWGLPLIGGEEVWPLQSYDYYDGPLSGICDYKGRVHYFWVRQDDWWRRIFNLYPLTDEQIEKKLYRAWEILTVESERKYSWAITDHAQSQHIFKRPWTEKRVDRAKKLPSIHWESFRGTTSPLGVFRWGEDPTPEIYDWADFVLKCADGMVHDAFPTCEAKVGIRFGWNETRHSELDIYDDGTFLVSNL